MFLVFLLLLVLVKSEREQNCDGFCPLFSMEMSLKKFRAATDHSYSGQEDAISHISRVLMNNMLDFNNLILGDQAPRRLKPLLLHFTGPTGVGKTLMASLITDALFISVSQKKLLFNFIYEIISLIKFINRSISSKRNVA